MMMIVVDTSIHRHQVNTIVAIDQPPDYYVTTSVDPFLTRKRLRIADLQDI